MTIALAIISRHAAVVASDSRRIESDGKFRDDWDKTFAVGNWLIGANAGLLEFSGLTMAEHVGAAIGEQPLSAMECSRRIVNYMREHVPKTDPTEVSSDHWRFDLLLAGRSPKSAKRPFFLFSITFKPGDQPGTLAATSSPHGSWGTAGNDQAMKPVELWIKAHLKSKLEFAKFTSLVQYSHQLVRAAICAASTNQRWKICECGGDPCTKMLLRT